MSLVYEESFIVSAEDCISQIDSTLPSLLGTYTLVKWMEIVSARNINRDIDTDKYITVGQEVSITHTGSGKPEDEVVIVSRLTHQEKRESYFEIEATIADKQIAKATHKRVLMPLRVVQKLV